MIKILFVITSSDIGGTENFLRQLTTGLNRELFDPLVCSLRPIGHMGRDIELAGVPVVSLNMAEKALPFEMFAAAKELRRLGDEHSVELVQTLLYRANLLAALSWGFTTRRRPVLIAGQRSLGAFSGLVAELPVRMIRGRFDRWIAVSGAVKDRFGTNQQFLDRVEVIGNGVDTERFSPTVPQSLRQNLGVNEGEILIGTAGRLTPKKAFSTLIDAVGKLVREGLPIQLRIAGEGEERALLEAQIVRLGLVDHVRLLGLRSDLADFYSALDVFALTSTEEGSPNALLEAMACQTACVATKVGGVEEIISEPGLASLIEPGNDTQLTNTLRELVQSRAVRSQMASAARKHVVKNCSLTEMILRHQELYRRLVDQKTRS